MRITNNMMITNMMRNLNRNMLRLDKRQMQVSTGKRVHKPSDDPIAVSRSLKIRADISQINQYNKNVDDAISWLETTELAVKNANEALHRLRELMVQAANGVLTEEETIKIQEEVKEIKAQLISLGNTSYGSSYVFSGKKTNQPLLDSNGNYNVDLIDYKNPKFVDDGQEIQVGNYEKIVVNTLGFQLFEVDQKFEEDAEGNEKIEVKAGQKAGLIQLIDNLEKHLLTGNTEEISNQLSNIDRYHQNLLKVKAEIGAKVNRMDLVKERLADDSINFRNLLSQLEDADMGEVIMELINEENVYRAALSVGARIIQPTLLDFLR